MKKPKTKIKTGKYIEVLKPVFSTTKDVYDETLVIFFGGPDSPTGQAIIERWPDYKTELVSLSRENPLVVLTPDPNVNIYACICMKPSGEFDYGMLYDRLEQVGIIAKAINRHLRIPLENEAGYRKDVAKAMIRNTVWQQCDVVLHIEPSQTSLGDIL
jgi:hypothetical protein